MEQTDSTFPLYEHLLNLANKMIEDDKTKEDITVVEVREMIEGIHKMDKETLDSVYLLVRSHSLRNDYTKNPFSVPFSGQKSSTLQNEENSNVTFDVRKFPPLLRRILLEFVRMYKNMNNK
jgi:hypothetical protein